MSMSARRVRVLVDFGFCTNSARAASITGCRVAAPHLSVVSCAQTLPQSNVGMIAHKYRSLVRMLFISVDVAAALELVEHPLSVRQTHQVEQVVLVDGSIRRILARNHVV